MRTKNVQIFGCNAVLSGGRRPPRPKPRYNDSTNPLDEADFFAGHLILVIVVVKIEEVVPSPPRLCAGFITYCLPDGLNLLSGRKAPGRRSYGLRALGQSTGELLRR